MVPGFHLGAQNNENEGPGVGWMWLKHSKYCGFVQSPTFVPNGVRNLLQSTPGAILGALLDRLGGTWAALGGLGRRLKDVPLALW